MNESSAISSLLPVNPYVDVNAPPTNSSDVEKTATQFESLFFSLLLKNMRTAMTEEGLFSGESSDTYGGMFDMFMSQHMAASGQSLGIGQMVATYLNQMADHQAAEPLPPLKVPTFADPENPNEN